MVSHCGVRDGMPERTTMADFENNPDLSKLMTIDPTGLSDDDAMTLAALLMDLRLRTR